LDIIEEVIRTRYTTKPITSLPKTDFTSPERLRTQPSLENKEEHPSSLWLFIPNHFLHNLVTSVFMLPTTFAFHDLRHTIKEIYPYWNKIDGVWLGALTWKMKIGLLWNLFLLALGLNIVWKKWRVAGLLPFLVFLTYHLSNALARTSGGRYLVSVDWVLFLYYAFGMVEIAFFILKYLGLPSPRDWFRAQPPVAELSSHNNKNSYILSILPFFLFVGAITLLDQSIPPHYAELRSAEIQEEVYQSEFFQESDISDEAWRAFLENPDARVLLGRSLYPRFYQIGEGEHSVGKDAFEDKDFPRITFTMIGQFGQTGVILPMAESPAYFPNVSDVILIGCQHSVEGYISPYMDAFMVILIDGDQQTVYTREPDIKLQCPLPEPVCDGNRQCR